MECCGGLGGRGSSVNGPRPWLAPAGAGTGAGGGSCLALSPPAALRAQRLRHTAGFVCAQWGRAPARGRAPPLLKETPARPAHQDAPGCVRGVHVGHHRLPAVPACQRAGSRSSGAARPARRLEAQRRHSSGLGSQLVNTSARGGAMRACLSLPPSRRSQRARRRSPARLLPSKPHSGLPPAPPTQSQPAGRGPTLVGRPHAGPRRPAAVGGPPRILSLAADRGTHQQRDGRGCREPQNIAAQD